MKNYSYKANKGGLGVKTAIKASGLMYNHNARGLKVRAGVKGGGFPGVNHNVRGLKVAASA